jgi:hypothetical protein
MSKLVNPFYYPIAVLVGGVILVIGVRFLPLPNLIILPTSIVATMVGASVLKTLEPNQQKLEQKQLQQELNSIKLMAENLANQSEILRQESQKLLSKSNLQIELLAIVEQACDRSNELPEKIKQLTQNIPNNQSLLSLNDLEQQLAEVKIKLTTSSGVSREYLAELSTSLEQNITLAQTGQDIRQAQIINLQKLVQESAGCLQQLQNKLRTSDLNNSLDIQELRDLTNEFNSVQENVNILIS